MNIGLDFYGVIANHLAAKATFARTVLGLTITEAEATREMLIKRLGENEYRRFALAFDTRPTEERLEPPLYGDARQVLDELLSDGDRFVVVSWQAVDGMKSVLEKYIAQRRLPISAVEVTRSDEEKRDACMRHGVQLFFDDNRSVLELMRPLGIVLVWANFYHRPEGGWGEPVAHSWREFVNIVRAVRQAEG